MGDCPEEKEVNDKSRDNILVLRQLFCSLSFLLPTCLTGINLHRCAYFFPLKKAQGDPYFCFLLLKSWMEPGCRQLGEQPLNLHGVAEFWAPQARPKFSLLKDISTPFLLDLVNSPGLLSHLVFWIESLHGLPGFRESYWDL